MSVMMHFICYKSEHESVSYWINEGYIDPPNKKFLLIWHNGTNHFNLIKHSVPSQQPKKVVDTSIIRTYKYLLLNNKNPQPSIDNVTNIEIDKNAQILPVSWDHIDHNINPPPGINNFRHKQQLLHGRFVKNKKVIHQ